ncbi:glycoside hydrolase family 16 protein [Nonlabens ponticola]|uniref:Glycoside hydrolase family 16 protein n=2 Tax=Nonlabens ponticola TaxID=2496866 RepID=A0A3S9N179_9FLAO|nr:glycoside hydrolase family 16 protein [Nonlabens ponticola]
MFNKIGWFLVIAVTILGCQDDDTEFGPVVAPSDLSVSFEVQGEDDENPNGDGTGVVTFSANASNALNYTYSFGDSRSSFSSDGDLEHRYVQQGVNTYTVTVTATGTGGAATSQTTQVTVFSAFEDNDAKQLLTGGSSKIWYWAAAEPGHLGVGPNNGDPTDGNNNFPQFYQAAPFEKNGADESLCLYEDQLVFSLNDDEELVYQLNNFGQTYFNGAFESVVGGSNGFDFCYDFDTDGVKNVTLSPSESIVPDSEKRGTTMTFSDDGFMSYYINTSVYDILELTENRMVVRGIMNGDLAWYHTFSTDDPNAEQGGDDNSDGSGEPEGTLVWSDEFDVDGAPNPANWTFDTGTGSDGWGNNEQQFYTDRTENIEVSNGTLKITARDEDFGGRSYTSSRIKTEGLFEFQYGTIEFSAKLPEGGGTWPAIWSLGADYQTNPWPAAGEIDYMEHIGNTQNTIYATVHRPGASGGNADGGEIEIENASSEFHTYRTIWNEDTIRFFVDGELIHQVANSDAVPFNKDFFIIMNIAMGGNFGGDIDPAFTESTMEVDYIRVYQ